MPKYEKIHHPMASFGIKEVSHAQIRFERLETRINPNIPFPHKHSFYQLLLITHGTGIHTIDFENHKVSPKNLYVMKPGQLHSWKLSSGARGIIVEFNRESVSSFKEIPLIDLIDSTDDSMTLSADKFKLLLQLFEVGLNLHEVRDAYLGISLEATLVNIIVEVIRLHPLKKEAKPHSVAHQFKALLETHFKSHHDLEFYAKQLGLSPKGLSMQLSRSLGQSARSLIHERIFLEAKRYLAFSDMPIGLISQELGFEDQNYFARFFKKIQGISPTEFRNRPINIS